MASSRDGLVGIVQVPLSNLQFIENIGERQLRQSHVNTLGQLFAHTQIEHSNPRHHIEGFIDNQHVQPMLQSLGISKENLRTFNSHHKYPVLTDQVVWFAQGRHRLEAARASHPSSLWTVRVSQADINTIRENSVAKIQAEEHHHELPSSDGHIYCKLRTIAADSSWPWLMQLSQFKRDSYLGICEHHKTAVLLDRLTEFPAIMEGFRFGTWPAIFQAGLEEEACLGLRYIYDVWSNLTGGDRTIKMQLRAEDIKILQGRSPGTCKKDQELICEKIRVGELYSDITDGEKHASIRRKTNGIAILIPSFATFFANMVYIRIAARITWKHLIPKELRRFAKERRLSLRSALRSRWTVTEPHIEVGEGEFLRVRGAPSFDLAYNTVMLAALRQFPSLSWSRPKIEPGQPPLQPSENPECIGLFQRRAMFLGFQRLRFDFARNPPFICKQSGMIDQTIKWSNQLDRRCGTPFVRHFPAIQQTAFLPHLHDFPTNNITVSFVFRNLMISFFQPNMYELDASCLPISIQDWGKEESPVNSAQTHHAMPGAPTTKTHRVQMPPVISTRISDASSMDLDSDHAPSLSSDVMMSDLSEANKSYERFTSVDRDAQVDQINSTACNNEGQVPTPSHSSMSRGAFTSYDSGSHILSPSHQSRIGQSSFTSYNSSSPGPTPSHRPHSGHETSTSYDGGSPVCTPNRQTRPEQASFTPYDNQLSRMDCSESFVESLRSPYTGSNTHSLTALSRNSTPILHNFYPGYVSSRMAQPTGGERWPRSDEPSPLRASRTSTRSQASSIRRSSHRPPTSDEFPCKDHGIFTPSDVSSYSSVSRNASTLAQRASQISPPGQHVAGVSRVLQGLQGRLQQRLNGCPPQSHSPGWQGFYDSDDDMVSIDF